MSNTELKRGCVVFMKRESGLIGWGNAQCVSWVSPEINKLSLYGHNEHYETYDVEKIVESPPDISELVGALRELCDLKNHKDTIGKDADYEKRQPEAWKKANEALKNYKP
jgi:hypothetical protein